MKNSELQLADVVYDPDHPELGLRVVKNISDGYVHFFRPYPHTADFSYTGGVICYVGIEEWRDDIDDDRADWVLASRKTLK